MLQAGAATIDITHETGNFIQAAGHVKRAQFVRDACEANALLVTGGQTTVMMVSLDLVGLDMTDAHRMRRALAEGADTGVSEVLIAGTHMHSGPSLKQTHPDKPIDQAYLDRLESLMAKLGKEAKASLRPARVGWGLGSAVIGYNRRCCWADGSHSMHGDCSRQDFRGLEGPNDPSHLALFAVDQDDRPIAVVHNNASHPTTFYGADFYSADFPGLARTYLREAFGGSPAVLYLNGAQGDISIEDQLTKHHVKRPRELAMRRTAHQIAGETLRLYLEAEFREHAVVAVAVREVALPLSAPAPERLKWAESVLRRQAEGDDVRPMDCILAYGVVSLRDELAGAKEQTVPLQAVRIGDVGFAAVPFELYCRFGLDIKSRSPAPLSGIVGLANGSEGYMPTPYAKLGGGYSGEPIKWTRFAPEAGFMVVDRAVDLLYELWNGADGSSELEGETQ